MYERTSDKQHQAVSNILSSTSHSTYQAQIAKLDSLSQNVAIYATRSNSSVSGIVPNITLNNCQVNVNFNQGPAPPVNFSSSLSSSKGPSSDYIALPSIDDTVAFLKDLD